MPESMQTAITSFNPCFSGSCIRIGENFLLFG
jgi:hypothetical protein